MGSITEQAYSSPAATNNPKGGLFFRRMMRVKNVNLMTPSSASVIVSSNNAPICTFLTSQIGFDKRTWVAFIFFIVGTASANKVLADWFAPARILVPVDARLHLMRRRSSSAGAKNASSVLRMSVAQRSALISRSSALSRFERHRQFFSTPDKKATSVSYGAANGHLEQEMDHTYIHNLLFSRCNPDAFKVREHDDAARKLEKSLHLHPANLRNATHAHGGQLDRFGL